MPNDRTEICWICEDRPGIHLMQREDEPYRVCDRCVNCRGQNPVPEDGETCQVERREMMTPVYPPRGTHVMIDGKGANAELLNAAKPLRDILMDAALACKCGILGAKTYQFEPEGLSICLLLRESHIAIHTYPAEGIWFADFFTCGDLDPTPGVDLIKEKIKCEKMVVTTHKRGDFEPPRPVSGGKRSKPDPE